MTTVDEFTESGFLSDWVGQWSIKHLIANDDLFSVAHRLNGIALNQLYSKDGFKKDFAPLEVFVFASLYVRSISNFECAVILLGRGMNIEARIIVRSLLECTFMLGAAYNIGSDFLDKMISSHKDARKKYGNNIKKTSGLGLSFTEDQIKEIDAKINEYSQEDTQNFDFYDAACKAGLENWYLFYRRLSNYSAHPSLDALEYFFDGDTAEIVFGPNENREDLLDTLSMACIFMTSCCHYYNEHLREDVLTRNKLEREHRDMLDLKERSEAAT